jgi:cyclic pyranopterin phosphate synthase
MLKINTVVMRGVNDDEIASLAALTVDKSYQVRFIELMPFPGIVLGEYRDLYIPIGEIIRKIPGIDLAYLSPDVDRSGPARTCSLPGARGKIGFIAPLSWHFCGTCNRLRLTADGNIRTCLFSDREMDIKTPLRNGASVADLIGLIREAVARKPRWHRLGKWQPTEPVNRAMHAIGG